MQAPRGTWSSPRNSCSSPTTWRSSHTLPCDQRRLTTTAARRDSNISGNPSEPSTAAQRKKAELKTSDRSSIITANSAGGVATASSRGLPADQRAEQLPVATVEPRHPDLLDRGEIGRAGIDLDPG